MLELQKVSCSVLRVNYKIIIIYRNNNNNI